MAMVPQSPSPRRAATGASAVAPPAGGGGPGQPTAGLPPDTAAQLPSLTLPKGGGALRGLDEQFQANPATGSASFSIPLPLSAGRGGFGPALALGYDSGAGNGPFGLGWGLGLGGVARRTEQGLPRYEDERESDEFRLGGGEVLVPALRLASGHWVPDEAAGPAGERVRRYAPRLEGSWGRIEKITPAGGPGPNTDYWRATSPGNVTTFFGLTPAARLADPADPGRVLEWLPELSYDDRGNCLVYEYKAEDLAGVPRTRAEENRHAGRALFTNRYLKRVRYGNRLPYGPALRANPYAPLPPAGLDFLFEAVFDYGEHELSAARPDLESQPWPARPDAFSDYRAGFERRTYRRCRQVLMFHRFPELGAMPALVGGLALAYRDTATDAARPQPLEVSYLAGATHTGYARQPDGSYAAKSLPPLAFQYQEVKWDTDVREVRRASAPNAPQGLSGPYRFVDLYGEGLAGLLSEQAGAWYYAPNEGAGRFGPARQVARQPSFKGLNEQLTLQPLEADGRLRAVSLTPGAAGSWALLADDPAAPEAEWTPFRPFEHLPNLDWNDPNLRLLDLTGDGRPDILLTEDEAFISHESEGVKGYAAGLRATRPRDEEAGPALLFADPDQSVFLADMSGDGLTDLVRVSNGSVCYWPNRGYGRFGAKVEMDDAPVFDRPDLFDPKYLRLADVSGTGAADLLYLAGPAPRAWLNLSGNRWSAPTALPALPPVAAPAQLDVLDLLGTGTACLVWSSGGLPGGAHAPLRFVDLMGALRPGQASPKPHVLVGYANNMGLAVELSYRPSTAFWLEDRRAGTPWATRLPFPVQCLAGVRSRDLVRETVLASSYRYRHGYYDGQEREFRGFGRVEQLDTQTYADFRLNAARNVVEADLHQPPVRTVSWFHTGAFFDRGRLLDQFAGEYFQNALRPEATLPEPPLPPDLSADEAAEALRAYKGLALRTETYADDGSALAGLPYATTRASYRVRRVQPRLGQRHAVLQALPAESLSYAYDRRPHDPRLSHSLVLEINDLGQPTRSASVVYGRAARPAPASPEAVPEVVWQEQSRHHVALSETDYTNDVLTPAAYRRRAACAQRAYELLGTPAAGLLTAAQLRAAFIGAAPLAFEAEGDGSPQKRLLSHGRAYFRADDLSTRLPLGQLGSLGLGYEGQTLAFTAGLVAARYGGKVSAALLAEAGYVHSEGDADWWLPSGRALYAADAADHFLLPRGARDPLGVESTVQYDAYNLLAVQTADALGNVSSAEIDYRTLGPRLVTDPNGNRAAVETDALGLVVKTAVLGKAGAGEGDTLADPSTRLEYDLDRWRLSGRPNVVHAFAREQHGPPNPRWQESFAYFDGGGGVLMTKSQANPGPARRWDELSQAVVEAPADPRWVGNGRTVFDNKGNVVRQYEPYFSATSEFESAQALVETGFSPLLHYDPLGRNFQTDLPDGTFVRTEFTPWLNRQFDPNDTVRASAWYQQRGAPDPAAPAPPPSAGPEARAAWLAARHADTPALVHLDALARPVLAVADYGAGRQSFVRTLADPAGRWARLFDQLDREISLTYCNLAGQAFYSETAERGRSWLLPNAVGNLARAWDNDRRTLRNAFDGLHRPRFSYYAETGQPEVLVSAVVWGETHPDGLARNLRGRPCQVYDGGGLVQVERVDFQGNTLEASRQLTRAYRGVPNWRALEAAPDAPAALAAAAPLLESETFRGTSTFDALGRPRRVVLPDGSVLTPRFNEANFLAELPVQVRGAGAPVSFMQGQDYDAKGQRRFVRYGNGVLTRYFYDPQTFRLTRLLSLRQPADPDAQALQDLRYTHDPVGNVTTLRDAAQPTHFFQNAVVEAGGEFEYDALYQLTRATGREHAGLAAAAQPTSQDLPFVPQLPALNDAAAVRGYVETYDYDLLGNILELRHAAGPGGSFTRRYQYQYQADAADRTNRLAATSRGTDAPGAFSDLYPRDPADPHGNLTSLPHLPGLVWNYLDQLAEADLGGGGRACYQYGGGQRVRKVVERPGGLRQERIYLGAVEIYREWQGAAPAAAPRLERWTLHVADSAGRIAQADTKTLDPDNRDPANPLGVPVLRYQLGNHLGSASVELDAAGQVISYEEYHPFGTSAYRAARPGPDLSLKRHRYAGQERDDETGLYYMSARYYVPWLGRWLSADPAGFVDGLNLHAYCRNNPVMLRDPGGTQSTSGNYAPGFTGRETFPELQAIFQQQHMGIDPSLNESNYQQRYIPGPGTDGAGGGWDMSARAAPPPSSEEITFPDEVVTGHAPPASAAEVAPPAPSAPAASGSPAGSAGSSGPAEERTFWNRGGGTLVAGGILLGAGLLTVFTAGAATPLLVLAAGAMATAGGVAVTSASAVQLGASYSGQTTANQDREMTHALNTTASLSSPLGLAGGTIGAVAASNPEQGLETGAAIGNTIDAAHGLGRLAVGGARMGLGAARRWALQQPYTFDPALANRVNGSTNWVGDITINPGIGNNAAKLTEVVAHEGLHRLLTPRGGPAGLLASRVQLRRWGYSNSHLLRFAEEGFAQSVGTESYAEGFKWIYRMRGPRPNGYGINMGRVALEGGAYLGIVGGLPAWAYLNTTQ